MGRVGTNDKLGSLSMGDWRDFNVILLEEEKLGGLPVTTLETTDFAQCICNCALSEFPFTGSIFTW